MCFELVQHKYNYNLDFKIHRQGFKKYTKNLVLPKKNVLLIYKLGLDEHGQSNKFKKME